MVIKLSIKQKILFIENLGSLINSGIPIMQALDIILISTKNKSIKDLSIYFKKQIESGESLFKASLKLSKIFNIFDMAMLEIGDSTGQIGKSFEIISQKEEKELDLKNKIKQALIYPISIIVVTFIMLIIIMTYVVPKIEVIYKDSNVNLPGITTGVIGVSHFFVNYGIFLGIGGALLIFGFITLLKNKEAKYFYDKNILKLPIFGPIFQKKILINFLDFLSTLLSAGIIINKALLIIRNGIGNAYYSREIDYMMQEVKNGNTLSSTMGGNLLDLDKNKGISNNEAELIKLRSKLFPIELSTAVKIGEQTGTLSKMLQKTSTRYSKEIDNVIKNLSTMLEPIIIVVIGGIVGVIVMAILMPFLNIVNVIK